LHFSICHVYDRRMADPTPVEQFEEERHRRLADDLRRTATELRATVAALADEVLELRAHDRSDVWQGAVAERSRLARADSLRRLTSPTSGAFAALIDAAARLDARAAAHDAFDPTTATLPVHCSAAQVPRPPWDAHPDCPR
jgi:hypothetical protein